MIDCPSLVNTGHGEANLRIVKNIVEWVRASANKIENLDPDKPLLPQFDLLTDQQVKQVMRAMDPLWINSRWGFRLEP